jgi:hypothetical protein
VYSLVSTCESQVTSKSAQKHKVKHKSHHEAWSVRKAQRGVCDYIVVSHKSVYEQAKGKGQRLAKDTQKEKSPVGYNKSVGLRVSSVSYSFKAFQ